MCHRCYQVAVPEPKSRETLVLCLEHWGILSPVITLQVGTGLLSKRNSETHLLRPPGSRSYLLDGAPCFQCDFIILCPRHVLEPLDSATSPRRSWNLLKGKKHQRPAISKEEKRLGRVGPSAPWICPKQWLRKECAESIRLQRESLWFTDREERDTSTQRGCGLDPEPAWPQVTCV